MINDNNVFKLLKVFFKEVINMKRNLFKYENHKILLEFLKIFQNLLLIC